MKRISKLPAPLWAPSGGQSRLACALAFAAIIMASSPAVALADGPTPQPSSSPTFTSTPTARPAPTTAPARGPTAIPRPTPKPEPRSTAPTKHITTPKSRHVAGERKHKHAKPRRRTKHKSHKSKPRPKPTSTPTLNLQAEDSIAPVICNGPPRPPTTHPFLTPPYRGWTSIVSFFDHDLPDFYQDGLIVTANGLRAAPDPAHHAYDFPAYWNRGIRQYLYYDGHNGYDYNLNYQPVFAAAPGKVIFASLEYIDAPDHGYGNMVMIDHRNGYVTLYGHFSKILVKVGQRVKRGQQIGVSGNTGHSTGPHLHFTVFHNCSPTDPYGWSGSGSDPLSGYQGESSVYLWLAPPLVTNPTPDWPGMSALSAPPITRILLLRLPPTSGGTSAFTRQLRSEAEKALRGARKLGASAHIDLLQGAIDVRGPIRPSQLYSLTGVVSITTSDTIEGEGQDVRSALARAALATSHKRMRVGKSRKWTGYFLRWSGRTFLVGRGDRGGQMTLRMRDGHGVIRRTVYADPANGAYAVDLGNVARGELPALQRQLSSVRSDPRVVRKIENRSSTALHAQPERQSTSAGGFLIAGVVVVAIALATLFGLLSRRRRTAAES